MCTFVTVCVCVCVYVCVCVCVCLLCVFVCFDIVIIGISNPEVIFFHRYLSYNQISAIPSNAWNGLSRLQYL